MACMKGRGGAVYATELSPWAFVMVLTGIALTQTHIDIIEDFSEDLITQLTKLSEELDFMIFEDRKFADIGDYLSLIRLSCVSPLIHPLSTILTILPLCILMFVLIGNTVSLQYSSGVHHISSWSHITNAHPIPGDGIITGLSSVGLPLNRGLLLLAEMSSKGNLASGLNGYTEETVQMARRHWEDGFVMGFIAMHRVQDTYPSGSGSPTSTSKQDFLILTPGVALSSKGDKMGQQYRTPREVIYESGCDVIIVGRGIYGIKGGEEEVKAEAERYRVEGWKAYEERVGKASE